MQEIITNNNCIHQLFDDFARFYQATSEKQQIKALLNPIFDSAFLQLQKLFNEYGGTQYNFDYTIIDYPKLKLPTFDSKNIIVCASGGKDSVACILHYIEKGYNVYVYHVKNANTGYPDEYKQLEIIADKLNIPLHIEEIHYKGKRDWIEHPMKNMMIANMALQWGIQNSISCKIAFGNFYTNYMDDNIDDFETTAGDQIEMWRCYEDIIRVTIPRFRMYISGMNYKTTMTTLERHFDILPYTISCVAPHRFRRMWHDMAEKKYNIHLLENRCGGHCWKCALEYIYFTDHNKFEYNEEYYNVCMKTLLKTHNIDNIDELYKKILLYKRPNRLR